MFCIYCGATLPEGATKCTICGNATVLPAAEKAEISADPIPEPAATEEPEAGPQEQTAVPEAREPAPVSADTPADDMPDGDSSAVPAEEEPAEPEAEAPAFSEDISSGEQLPLPQDTPAPAQDMSYTPPDYADNYVYEEYEEEEAAPRKKRSLLWLWIALPIVLAVAGTVTGILLWYNAPMQQLTRALDANDYSTVTTILPQLSESELDSVSGQMKTYAETVLDRYNRGEAAYTNAYELLDRLRRLFPASGLDSAVDRIQALKASKDAFTEAQKLEKDGEAAGAISRYGAVIEEDVNYEAAQAQIESIRTAYKEQVLSEAQALADAKDYLGARAALLNSSEVLGDDPDIAAKLEELQKAEFDDYVQSLLKTAQGFADEGDYAGAIQLLEDATKQDERFDKQIEAYRQEYKEKALSEAADLAGNADYTGAVAVLEKSRDLLGDDADISEKIAEYEAMYPVLLVDLSPTGGTDCATSWSASDASGNTYGNGLSFSLYPVIQRTVETEYAPNGQYRRLSGTWVVEGDSSDDFIATVRVYVDGSLQYETSTLTRASAPAGMSLIIEGAQSVRIEVEGAFATLRSTGYVYLADATFSN